MATLSANAPRITQETFDDCVKENMEEFDMEKDEAIQDAITQFGAQGVDLVNIDISGVDRESERKATKDALEALKLAVTTKDVEPDEAICRQALKDLIVSCTNESTSTEGSSNVTDDKNVSANKSVIAMFKGPAYIAALMGFDPLVEDCLDCLKVISGKHMEVKDAFPFNGMIKFATLIQFYATNGKNTIKEHKEGEPVVPVADEKALNIITKCCEVVYILSLKNEPNKQGFVRKETGGLIALYNTLRNCADNAEVVRVACMALRSICTFDDLRKDFSGAYDAAKEAVKIGFVVELLKLAKAMSEQPDTLAAVYMALRAIACNDEAVQQICAGGGLTMAEGYLKTHQSFNGVCKQAAALLRNLAGNDSVKTSLCSVETLELLITAVSTHVEDAQLAEHVIATFAAMALRVPSNCERILGMGGGRLISGSMRRFSTVVPLQRQSCLAVRNLVGRCPHLKEPLLEDDMEGLLRHAGTLPGSIDAAFAALRDLGLEVSMITIDPDTGEIRQGVQQFGEVKSAFRAVYDDAPGMDDSRNAAMNAAAKSPAELGYKM